eukprot:jgi/Psemu1/1502/gm1.1502_g
MVLPFAFCHGNSFFSASTLVVWFELFHPERARLLQLLLGLGLLMLQLKIFGLGLGHLQTQQQHQQQQQTTVGLNIYGRNNSNNNPTTICSSQEVYIESLSLPYYALAAWVAFFERSRSLVSDSVIYQPNNNKQCLLQCRELCILALASASFCADIGSSNSNSNSNSNKSSTVDTIINSNNSNKNPTSISNYHRWQKE